MMLKKYLCIILGLFSILLFSSSVIADMNWYIRDFGGKAEIEEVLVYQWNSIDFGGKVEIEGPPELVWDTLSFGGKVLIETEEPYVYDEEPTNGSTSEAIDGITLSISVTEYQEQNFNITWTTNATDWIVYNSSCIDGTYTQYITWANTSNVTYWWNVSVNDTEGNWNNHTYHFTTASYEWGNWSSYWKIGYTSKYDLTLSMTVNVLDVSSVAFHYNEEGDPGWISQDINNDGIINYFDIGGVGVHYGEDYT